ncbi:d-lactaldehyde dehydrogenase [Moniliophthora roreri]|uniref:NAD-dependent epimerase/dehydratase domain-containing protein n=1 Tax=Moniliophthora roreri TaxID=221103 RepID=A0A0W0FUZ5_MONRR|nr:d-lactaldehyde dehydrogenase [Moniliophthora roreri]
MPIITNGSKAKVLVTGVSGYVATWVARVLLERGHDVVGTVRSDAKGKQVAVVFEKLGYTNGRFKWVVIEDIAQEGAFDEFVKDIDAIAHVASPFHYNAVDPQELIRPAVDGTIGVLESARKFGTLVRRVVVTSSTAAVYQVSPDPITLDESSWGDQAVQEVEAKGKDTPAATKYRATVWNYCETHKGKLKFDVTALNPSMVYGPEAGLLTSPSSLGTSAGAWFKTITTTEPDATGLTHDALSNKSVSWIDVRDLAEAHARAFEREEAGGERIIIAYSPSSWQQWLDVANAINPTSRPLAKGVPGLGADLPARITYLVGKAERILGISHTAPGRPTNGEGLFKYHSLEETSRDTLKDYEERGW